MGDTTTAAVVGGIAGLLTGAVSSLVAPWVNWRIERRRAQHTDRRERVQEWRQGVAAMLRDHPEEELERQGMLNEPWFQSLRGHLSEKAMAYVEPPPRVFPVPPDDQIRDHLATVLMNEIDRVEREWGLP